MRSSFKPIADHLPGGVRDTAPRHLIQRQPRIFPCRHRKITKLFVDVCGFASVVALNEPGKDFIAQGGKTLVINGAQESRQMCLKAPVVSLRRRSSGFAQHRAA